MHALALPPSSFNPYLLFPCFPALGCIPYPFTLPFLPPPVTHPFRCTAALFFPAASRLQQAALTPSIAASSAIGAGRASLSRRQEAFECSLAQL